MRQLDIRFDPPKLIPSMRADDPFMRLAEDWRIEFRGETWTIPAGFESDGASIPWWLVPICGSPWKSPRIIAALVHDSNYAGNDPDATREEADDLYRDMQIACGIPRWKAYVEWLVLRRFGGSHWYAKTKKKGRIMMKKLMFAAVAAAVATGCATKTRNVEMDGMFVQADSATLALGSIDVMAAPVGEESAIVKYSEDTAWLNPETKTHSIRIQLTGTNCTEKVDAIVDKICRAFVPTAAIVNGVSARQQTNVVMRVEAK